MKHLSKRLIALLLTLAMVLSLIPMVFAEEPAAGDEYVLATELKDGDKVVIYHPASGKAMSSTLRNTYYREGVDVTVEDGAITSPDAALVWTVQEADNGFKLLDPEGHCLSMQGTYNSIPNDQEHDVWSVREGTNNTVNITNVLAPSGNQGDPKAIEYYNNQFTGYYLGTGDAFALQLYVLKSGGDDPVDPPVEGELTGKTVILHTNDTHGALMGFAQVAKVKADYEAKGANVILVDAGDFSQGTTYVSTNKGAAAVTMLNAAGYDFVTLGNHEFDFGYAQLVQNFTAAEFQPICADILLKETGEPAFTPSVIKEVGGVKIGFFGMETPETFTKVNPGLIQEITFPQGEELYACAQAQVDALKAQGADLVIGLVHLGVDDESEPNRSIDLYANVTGIDFLIDGHSHTVMTQGPNGEPIQSTGTKASKTALMNIGLVQIDNATKTIEKNELIPLGADAPVDETVAALAQQIMDAVDAEYGAKFAESKVELNGDRAPGNRTEETNLGDLITDSMLWGVTKEGGLAVDNDHAVAITNGGGIRAWIHAGDVTKNDVNTVLPFGNTVAVVYVSGSELLEALEASTYSTPGAVGGFPQVAGMKFTINTRRVFDQGEQYPDSTYYKPFSIQRVTIDEIGGKPFDPAATYAVITNNFCAAGGDTYYAFKAASDQFDTGIPLDEMLISYITEKLGGVIGEEYAEPQGRIEIKTCFDDVADPGRYYYEPVYWAVEQDPPITSGTGNNLFSPDKICNRAQIVTFLWAAAGKPEPKTTENPFSDVPENAWYTKAVLWAVENKVASGTGNGLFSPMKECNRATVVTFMWAAAGKPEPKTTENPFTDVPDNAWYTKAVLWAVENKITSGTGGGKFSPMKTCTRGQIVTFLYAAATKDLAGKTVILHTNDTHGALLGFAQVAALKQEYKKRGADVILVDAGDYSQGTIYVSTNKGAAAVEMLNAAGYDYVTLGNHEFDFGYAQLMQNFSIAEFLPICADILLKETGEPAFTPSVIKEVGGVKIGFFGMETPETFTKVNPGLIQEITFPQAEEMYACAQAQVDALKAQGADVIVGLVHLGVDDESIPNRSIDLYENVTGIDFLIDGHSHTVMTQGPNGEPIQSTGTKASDTALMNVGLVQIDNFTKTVEKNELIPITADTPADKTVYEKAKEIMDAVDAEYNEKFAESLVELNGTKSGDANFPVGNRNGETNLGDLITDAMLWSVTKEGGLTVEPNHVIAITNGGGIRAPIHVGDVTKKDVNTVLPFGNTVAVVYVTGAELLEALEASCAFVPGTVGGFPQVSGIKFTIDTSKEFDQGEQYPNSTYHAPASIQRVTINEINGEAFDENAVYAVVTNNFCAAGGDTYYAFKAASDQFDTSLPLDEVLMDYITEELNGVIGEQYAEPQGRIIIKEAPDYVLFGYINGANYACEDDWENPGEYVFDEEGKLTATFTENSYVAVKLSDNSAWYMTNGWLGEEVTSATLYNTETLGEAANKLFVPGGVEVVFTLVENEDGTLTLSYEKNVEPVNTEFEFLVTSDLHGQIFATDYTQPYEKSGTYSRGLTRVSTYIKEQKAIFGDNLYVVDMGDTFQGAPLTYYYAFNKPDVDDPAIKAFRSIGYDMWLVGNHEFNYGLEILNRQMAYAVSDPTENEKQLTICLANYLDASTNSDESKDWATWKGYAPYVIKDFGGYKVAIIGFGNPNVPKWDVPANWEGIYFANIIETYQHYEAEMLEQADMIVVVAHSGTDSDPGSDFMKELVESTDTIAFAFSGHEHKNTITKVTNASGKEISILSPYTKARRIAQVKVTVNGDEITVEPELVNMENYPLDEDLVEILQPYETDTWENYMLQPIGQALGDYPAANLGTAPSAFMDLINTVQAWGAYDRTGENTPDKTEDDVPPMLSISAPLTSGNNENLISEGPIVLGDMFGLYRFENWFYQITMTGEEVHQWLEFAATKIQIDDEGKPYVTNGNLTYYDVIFGDGFHYDIDVSKPEGERVVNMTWQGAKVEADQVFTVVVNNYRYNGGGNYVNWLNEHGCSFTPNDPDRIIYSTQFDMIQGEDEGQARALLVSYIKEQTALYGGITPFITSDWTVQNGIEEPAPDYVLFGWINGANYGCEDDAENPGEYVFDEDGKLTATFTENSYVAVKLSDNSAWYMTNGWLGEEVTSATLYNTETLGEAANKLFVPGGVEITFTLVENEDDTLTLSYEAGELPPVSVETTFPSTENNDIEKYGNIFTSITAVDFAAAGFTWGDIVTVKFLDKEIDLPVVPSYSYVDQGTPLLYLGKNGETVEPEGRVKMAINMGNFAEAYGLAYKTTNPDKTYFWTAFDGVEFPVPVTIEMKEQGGYLTEMTIRDINRTNNREDYPNLTDEEFANFRQITTTGMGDHLYRGSSPINPEIGRNTYADAALENAKVTVIMNLANSQDEAEGYEGYADTYYSQQNIVFLNLGVDFMADDFKTGLAAGLRFFAANEGVYYVHCTEGKDRAGFVSAILECLMGATYDEVVADYLKTYQNYYTVVDGVQQPLSEETLNAIAESNIIKTLKTCFGVEDLTTADLAAEAEEYLTEIGLTEEEITALKANLAGEYVEPQEPDYVLCGWINGAACSDEGDWDNPSPYVFDEDGKLTVTFTEDSYIWIKLSDNSTGFKTDGYVENETSAIFYDYNVYTDKDFNKMKVPGGVELTFTLVVNEDDTLTLSYETAGEEPNKFEVLPDGSNMLKYGHIDLDIPVADFLEIFALGDIVTVEVNGYTFDAPVVTNYDDVDTGEYLIRCASGKTVTTLAINYGQVGVAAGIIELAPEGSNPKYQLVEGLEWPMYATIELKEAGGYADELAIRKLTRTNVRSDYDDLTDEEFANFRVVSTTGMGSNALYRTSSPIDPDLGRNTYADAAAAAAGIKTIVNLADTEEEAAAFEGYADTYYSQQNVLFLGLPVAFTSDEFKAGLANGYRYITANDGPYMIHCLEGKDRTGLSVAVLECLMGATLAEVQADYLKTYENYFEIQNNEHIALTDEQKAVLTGIITKNLGIIFGVEDMTTADLAAEAEAYLAEIGLTEEEIAALKVNLGKTWEVETPPEKPDYVLFGYINGANYACEDDAENPGEYVFDEEGKLTATFTENSYVAVKLSDNSAWYMTNGWLGEEVTSATLYNTETLGDAANKLFVPGGVEVTFTLVVNEDDTLTLSYETAEEPVQIVYQLVTEEPEDWTGTYLIAYTSGETTYVFNGNEEVNGHVTTTVTDNKIVFAEGMEPVVIAAMEDGYSLHVTNGYMYGQSDKNLLKFGEEPSLTTIALDESGNAVITNNTAIFRFNTASNQLRFRFYKPTSTSMPLVQLYKLVEG